MSEGKSDYEKMRAMDVSERLAFISMGRGSWSVTVFRNGLTGEERPVNFGKAECEFVPFREFWQGTLPALGWTTFVEGAPKPALGMAQGWEFSEVQIFLTDSGRSVIDAFYRHRKITDGPDLIGHLSNCAACGSPVAHVLCNAEGIEGRDHLLDHFDDYGAICTNPACAHHVGEGYFQDWPDWAVPPA